MIYSQPLVSIAVVSLTLGPNPAFGEEGLVRVGEAKVEFTAVGPGGLKIDGTTSDLEVQASKESLKVICQLSTLTTGISLRDRHMRDKYLETAKYPTAELRVARSALTMPAAGGRSEGTASGILLLHGREKPVTFSYRVEDSGGGLTVSGKLAINIQDWDIQIPSYLGITVKPGVEIAVTFKAKQR